MPGVQAAAELPGLDLQLRGRDGGVRVDQIGFFNDNAEYDAFVDKFKPKKTTDDCYTPPEVYKAIKNWACQEYGIKEENIVRPFYPGGDYENFCYAKDTVVLDNPPFSILTQICEFYLGKGIKFFLFSPSLTVLSGRKVCMEMTHIVCDAEITYENGAVVRTAFVTNMAGDVIAQTAPDLGKAIAKAQETNKVNLPKYAYPDHVLTAAMLQKYSKYGVDFSVRKKDCVQISALDSQRAYGKTIFGTGLLLSEKAAAEKAAAEKAAAEKAGAIIWGLSEREMGIVNAMAERNED